MNKPAAIIEVCVNFFSPIIPDKLFLRIKFRLYMGYWMDFSSPKTFNEKLQWLKVYNRKSIMTDMVDKVEAKNYVAKRIGEEYIIPTLDIYESVNDINFENLPDKFVLKCTHDSGGLVICKDKKNLDINTTKKKLAKSLKNNYYYKHREWPYKNVKPRIIAEQYMEDESGYELKDYKFFCFDGDVKMLFIATDRSVPNEETKFDFYDADFKHLPFTNGHPNAKRELKRPKGFEKMKELASKLSKGHPHLRVDFYDVNGKIYFGELTFYHWSGMVPFKPKEWDYKIGEWIELPK